MPAFGNELNVGGRGSNQQPRNRTHEPVPRQQGQVIPTRGMKMPDVHGTPAAAASRPNGVGDTPTPDNGRRFQPGPKDALLISVATASRHSVPQQRAQHQTSQQGVARQHHGAAGVRPDGGGVIPTPASSAAGAGAAAAPLVVAATAAADVITPAAAGASASAAVKRAVSRHQPLATEPTVAASEGDADVSVVGVAVAPAGDAALRARLAEMETKNAEVLARVQELEDNNFDLEAAMQVMFTRVVLHVYEAV